MRAKAARRVVVVGRARRLTAMVSGQGGAVMLAGALEGPLGVPLAWSSSKGLGRGHPRPYWQ